MKLHRSKEEPSHSSQRRKKRPILFYLVALGAIFLFSTFLSNKPDSSSLPAGMLASLPGIEASSGEVWATRAIVPETPELLLVQDSGIRAATPPGTVRSQVLGSLDGSFAQAEPQTSRYVVQEGDTVASLAGQFGISQDTILWANELSGGSQLREGGELVILPVSGTLHLVRPYDTLSEIARWYQGDVEEIADFNNLDSPEKIVAGDLLIIPNGMQPSSVPAGRLTPIANSYFIYPIPAPHRVTQGLHPYNAVDLGNGYCGEPIYAAAGGTVQQTSYNSTAGNYVRILHPNGVVTFYAHLSQFAVSGGARVYQGQIIGYTGHTGYTIPAGSAGCHLHFEVRGARNPFL